MSGVGANGAVGSNGTVGVKGSAGPTTANPGDPDTQATEAAPRWVTVCRVVDLEPERGAAALLDGEQLALVRLLDDRVLAVQQLDPFSGAYVVSRGIVGSRLVDGHVRPTIASPMYKQVFDLESGACLDPVGGEPQDLRTWDVRVVDGEVQVRVGVVPDGESVPDGDTLPDGGVPGPGSPGGGP